MTSNGDRVEGLSDILSKDRNDGSSCKCKSNHTVSVWSIYTSTESELGKAVPVTPECVVVPVEESLLEATYGHSHQLTSLQHGGVVIPVTVKIFLQSFVERK